MGLVKDSNLNKGALTLKVRQFLDRQVNAFQVAKTSHIVNCDRRYITMEPVLVAVEPGLKLSMFR